jgi:hypothetical protein
MFRHGSGGVTVAMRLVVFGFKLLSAELDKGAQVSSVILGVVRVGLCVLKM